eukprot:598513-Amphidinium_carterae.1
MVSAWQCTCGWGSQYADDSSIMSGSSIGDRRAECVPWKGPKHSHVQVPALLFLVTQLSALWLVLDVWYQEYLSANAGLLLTSMTPRGREDE